MSVHSNQAHKLLSECSGKVPSDETNQLSEGLYTSLIIVLESIHVTASDLAEAFLDLGGPHDVVNQKRDLCRILINPLLAVHLQLISFGVVAAKRFSAKMSKSVNHSIDHRLEIDFDLVQQLKRGLQLDVFLPNTRNHFLG